MIAKDTDLRKEFLRWGRVVRIHIRALWVAQVVTLVVAVLT